MKKTTGKKPKPNNDLKLSTGVKLDLKTLITNIENEIKVAERLNIVDTSEFEQDQTRVNIGRHICIELAGEQFAIPLTTVQEAGNNLLIQPLPLLPNWIAGIINIRGEILSAIDLNLFFNTKSNKAIIKVDIVPYLIVHNVDIKVAIIVDKIIGTRPLYTLASKKLKKIEKKNNLYKYFSSQVFYGKENIQKEIFIFDLDKFLSSSRLNDFSTAQPHSVN